MNKLKRIYVQFLFRYSKWVKKVIENYEKRNYKTRNYKQRNRVGKV